ncbi:ATP-binding protein [Mangrovibacterium marinum]|uniref:histidine kinase n=1 Tax=Mangrovibacterium marinum TaxID=1639118 RepID=A0A2T5C2Q6_9BACT|nr:ATP-binding protein [Mangrovibacterium marinum]PTN08995.1 two-component system OmpR family sensor kinase/two-component system phosphate regulon sensor histidine kinase PhoR [Mangrovibacterium marinum]
MLKQRTYQQRIFIYFFSAFTVFTLSILAFQYSREKAYRTNQLENTLDNVAQMTNLFIQHKQLDKNKDYRQLDSIVYLIPDPEIRVTVIDPKGRVLFDSFVDDYSDMENHFKRPEVQKALYNERGANIRNSATTGLDFYYYARNYDEYFIRCAAVYNIKIQHFLKTSRVFIFFMIALFLLMWILLYIVTKRLGEFITKLRDFAMRAGKEEDIDPNYKFPDSEFGDIQLQIVRIYNRLKRAKDDLSAEKERLFNHLYALNEGIAFFTTDKEKILANSHFIQYINLISEHSTISAESLFDVPELKPLIEKIEEHLQPGNTINPKNPPQVQITVAKNEMFFRVQGIVFADRSFEILIEDVTRPEKRRLLKQQLTSNIAHELKTPLASIKGYLETLLSNKNVPQEKMHYFIERAHLQSERLNELLNDISLLNNIEDAGDLFEFKQVKLRPLINDVVENLESRIAAQEIKLEIDIAEQISVYGNDSLLSSIFQNFIENSINYAGPKVTLRIKQYLEDEKYYYFSYSDTGKGIPEEHLSRIFERFYRVDEGRTRDTGGTGLGLAIVKNAVSLHKGEISVRNRPEGGLEFLFSLAK